VPEDNQAPTKLESHDEVAFSQPQQQSSVQSSPALEQHQAPTQYPPRKTGMSTGMIVFVSLLAALVVVIVCIGLFFVFAAFVANQDYSKQSEPTESTSSPTVKTATYENVRTMFSYPSTWEKDSLNNVTVVGDGTIFDKANFSSGNDVAMDYRMIGSGSTPATGFVERSKRVEAMQSAVSSYQSASVDSLISLSASYGLGCIDSFVYTSKPAVITRDELVGVQFGYSCTSIVGVKTNNQRIQWYDTAGVRHLLIISATTSYWGDHSAELNAISDSIELKPLIAQ
jgi:hypothetical protein